MLSIAYVRSPKYGEKLSADKVDWWGMLFLIAFIGSLQFVLEHGQQDDWFEDPLIVGLSVLSVFGLLAFVWRESVYEHPIVNLKVLKDSNLRIGVVMSFIMGFGLFGSTFIIPIYTQSILGWTATDAGLLLIPSSLMTAFMMPFVGQMIQRGLKKTYMVAAGFSIFVGFTLWMYTVMTPDTGAEHFFKPLILRGVGLGLLFVPITTMSLSTLKGKAIGEGAAFTGMLRQLGGSFGIAIISTFITRFTQAHRVDNVAHEQMSDFAVQQRLLQLKQGFMAKGFSANEALERAYAVLQGGVMKQATVLSYMDIFLYLGILFAICIPFILLVKEGKNKIDMADAMH